METSAKILFITAGILLVVDQAVSAKKIQRTFKLKGLTFIALVSEPFVWAAVIAMLYTLVFHKISTDLWAGLTAAITITGTLASSHVHAVIASKRWPYLLAVGVAVANLVAHMLRYA